MNVSQKHALKHGHVELKMSEFSSISMHVPRKTLPSCSNIMRLKRRWVSALKCSCFSQHDDSTDLTRGKKSMGVFEIKRKDGLKTVTNFKNDLAYKFQTSSFPWQDQ